MNFSPCKLSYLVSALNKTSVYFKDQFEINPFYFYLAAQVVSKIIRASLGVEKWREKKEFRKKGCEFLQLGSFKKREKKINGVMSHPFGAKWFTNG